MCHAGSCLCCIGSSPDGNNEIRVTREAMIISQIPKGPFSFSEEQETQLHSTGNRLHYLQLSRIHFFPIIMEGVIPEFLLRKTAYIRSIFSSNYYGTFHIPSHKRLTNFRALFTMVWGKKTAGPPNCTPMQVTQRSQMKPSGLKQLSGRMLTIG